MMELFPEKLRKTFPRLGSERDKGLECIVRVHFFLPVANMDWYGIEFDGQDLFYGLVRTVFGDNPHWSLTM